MSVNVKRFHADPTVGSAATAASDSSFDVIFIDEEFVDLEREQRFAELREAWAKKTVEF